MRGHDQGTYKLTLVYSSMVMTASYFWVSLPKNFIYEVLWSLLSSIAPKNKYCHFYNRLYV